MQRISRDNSQSQRMFTQTLSNNTPVVYCDRCGSEDYGIRYASTGEASYRCKDCGKTFTNGVRIAQSDVLSGLIEKIISELKRNGFGATAIGSDMLVENIGTFRFSDCHELHRPKYPGMPWEKGVQEEWDTFDEQKYSEELKGITIQITFEVEDSNGEIEDKVAPIEVTPSGDVVDISGLIDYCKYRLMVDSTNGTLRQSQLTSTSVPKPTTDPGLGKEWVWSDENQTWMAVETVKQAYKPRKPKRDDATETVVGDFVNDPQLNFVCDTPQTPEMIDASTRNSMGGKVSDKKANTSYGEWNLMGDDVIARLAQMERDIDLGVQQAPAPPPPVVPQTATPEVDPEGGRQNSVKGAVSAARDALQGLAKHIFAMDLTDAQLGEITVKTIKMVNDYVAEVATDTVSQIAADELGVVPGKVAMLDWSGEDVVADDMDRTVQASNYNGDFKEAWT